MEGTLADYKGLSPDRIESLKNEIEMSEALNEQELQPTLQESIERYTGVHIPSIGMGWDIILNEVYPIIQSNLPAIFFRNPRAFLKPRHKTFIKKQRNPMTGAMESIQADSAKSAKTQEALLNYSLVEMKYKKEARRTLFDALLFPFGVMWHGYKGDFGMTEEDSIFIKDDAVFVKRINPLRFLHDPSVGTSNIDEGKWVARAIDIPIQELYEDDKLDVDKKKIKGFKGFGEQVGKADIKGYMMSGGKDTTAISKMTKSLLEYAKEGYKNSDACTFVRVYEVFLRPTRKERRDGKNGWILLITDEQEKPLRINDWLIKAEGFPCKILEFNELPDNKFGLSDVDTYKSVADQKNAIINQQLNNAQEMGKTWVGISKEGANEEDIDAVKQGGNTIVTFESGNPRDRMYIASGSGQGSSELYLIDGRIQRNLEDKSGVTDLKRGYLQSGEESAASVKIRAAGGSARPAYRQDIMSDFLKESFLYINQINKQFVPFKDAVRIMGTLDIEWSENPSKEDLQADIDVEIDAISMLPENPEKELMSINDTLTLMISALNNPAILQKLREEGKTFNLAPLVEQMLLRQRINDPNIFRNIEPDESQGYASIQQLREAEANIEAVNTNQQVPFPPKPEDDHTVKLEVYSSIQRLLQQQGQVNQTLEMLIQMQSALLQQVMEKQQTPGQKIDLPKFNIKTV
jgi:hypothetical protein